MKIVKIVIITLVALIALSGLGLIAMVTLVNPNSYKPLIIKAVNDSTGRSLTLDGDITWKIWPNIGLHMEKVALSNPVGFNTPTMASLNSAD